MNEEIMYINLDDIIPNRFQPRETFDEVALNELAQSIKTHGVIQPILVRNVGSKYEIIAGERRYKASILAGLNQIPAIVRNLNDKDSSKIALLENLQREDLTAIEEARTYQTILSLDNITQEELGRSLGKTQSAISNKLRLLNLPIEVQDALLKEKISERHARSLLNVVNKEDQIDFLNLIIKYRMSVKDLDQAINEKYRKKEEIPTSVLNSFVETEKDNYIMPTADGNTAIGAGVLMGEKKDGILSALSREEAALDRDIFETTVDEKKLNKPKTMLQQVPVEEKVKEQPVVEEKPEIEKVEDLIKTENKDLDALKEELKEEALNKEFNTPIPNIGDIKIKTDIAVQPRPIEEKILPSKPSPRIELMMKSQEFKRALLNYDRITHYLESKGISVEEERSTYEDRLELKFIFRK